MKKFTDSEKWRDPWFRSLDLQTKILWIFLLDEVDNAGTWEVDEDYFQYSTGIKKDFETLLRNLGDRIVFLPDERRILVPKYCFFQQGGFLTENKPAHRRIFQLLQRYDLQQDEKGNLSHSNGIAMPSVCHSNGINIGIGIGIGSGKKENKGCGEKEKTKPDLPADLKDDFRFLAAWEEWISYRKERNLPTYKPRGLAALHAQLTKWADRHGSPALVSTINHCIANSYNGLHEPQTRNHRQADPDRDYEHALD